MQRLILTDFITPDRSQAEYYPLSMQANKKHSVSKEQHCVLRVIFLPH